MILWVMTSMAICLVLFVRRREGLSPRGSQLFSHRESMDELRLDQDLQSNTESKLGLGSLIRTIRVKSKSFSSIMGTKTLRLRRVIASLSSFLRNVKRHLSKKST